MTFWKGSGLILLNIDRAGEKLRIWKQNVLLFILFSSISLVCVVIADV